MKTMTSIGDELWNLHVGLSSAGLTQLIDISLIPQKMREVERKYRIADQNCEAAIANLFGKVGSLVRKKNLVTQNLVTFVGIDQYYIFKVGRKEFHFRYRSGANRPPQLTVKFQFEKKSNLERGELNLGLPDTHPNTVKFFMSILKAMIGIEPIMFSNQQSGEIWTIIDPKKDRKVEIVVYRVKRFAPTLIEGAFIEIEPLEHENTETALKTIAKYEKSLGLTGHECLQSIAELFRPGNEHLLKVS